MTTAPTTPRVELAEALEDVTHDLKTWPAYFGPTWDNRKTFEVRFDDRGFQAGDLLALSEWDQGRDCDCRDRSRHHDRTTCARYTGRIITAEVGYVLSSTPRRGALPGFDGKGFVVLALTELERFTVSVAPLPAATALAERRPDWTGPSSPPVPAPPASGLRKLPPGGHNPAAANCLLNEGGGATNITCSPCQLAGARA